MSTLRGYQRDAVRQIHSALEEHRSTLVVMATGLGKTQVFCDVAANWPGRVLVLAHRQELVEQARRRLEQMSGEMVGVEMADFRASPAYRLAVGSIDTVKQRTKIDGGYRYPRMELMGDFDLIIVDEAHHYVAATYRRPLEYWGDAKVLGVTATPDRKDEKALGQIFESVAYVHDILDGINDGYLVPGKGCSVWLDDLDISDVKVQGGDLAIGALDEATLNACEAICQHVLEHEPERQGLLFFPGVKSAHYAAERLNVLKPGSACCVDGKTPKAERDSIVRAFKRGEYQYFANCQIATEGFDHPQAAFVVPRLTKSRALYAQMVGRVTRVLPNLVDHLEHEGERREAIGTSAKPHFTIYDFCGNAGRHDLMSARDALGGNDTEAVVRRAKQKENYDGEYDIQESLQEAARELQELAKQERAAVIARRETFDPFRVLDVNRIADVDFSKFRFSASDPPSRKQLGALQRFGLQDSQLKDLTKAEASALMDRMIKRRQKGQCTFKQLQRLQKYGVTRVNVSFDGARRGLDYLNTMGWDAARVDTAELNRLIGDN